MCYAPNDYAWWVSYRCQSVPCALVKRRNVGILTPWEREQVERAQALVPLEKVLMPSCHLQGWKLMATRNCQKLQFHEWPLEAGSKSQSIPILNNRNKHVYSLVQKQQSLGIYSFFFCLRQSDSVWRWPGTTHWASQRLFRNLWEIIAEIQAQYAGSKGVIQQRCCGFMVYIFTYWTPCGFLQCFSPAGWAAFLTLQSCCRLRGKLHSQLYRKSPDWLKGQLQPEGNRKWFVTGPTPVLFSGPVGKSWSDAEPTKPTLL